MRTTLFGKESVSNLGGKIWPLLPEELKNAWGSDKMHQGENYQDFIK